MNHFHLIENGFASVCLLAYTYGWFVEFAYICMWFVFIFGIMFVAGWAARE